MKVKQWLKDHKPVFKKTYNEALRAGASGGKLLGAGGGGFFLLFVKPQHQHKVRNKLKRLLEVKFKFERQGSQIIFYQDAAFK